MKPGWPIKLCQLYKPTEHLLNKINRATLFTDYSSTQMYLPITVCSSVLANWFFLTIEQSSDFLTSDNFAIEHISHTVWHAIGDSGRIGPVVSHVSPCPVQHNCARFVLPNGNPLYSLYLVLTVIHAHCLVLSSVHLFNHE